jgi:predicted metal-binding membrane protein
VVDGRPHAWDGRRSGHRARDARLVPQRLARDDGGDDVPVRRADGRALLASSYLLTWGAAGVVAFVVSDVGGRLLGDALVWGRAGRWLAGGIVLAAAVYEFTPAKNVCLSKCRSPLGFLLGSWRKGLSGALGMGVRHGAWCVGCCWALMASLFALGVMSIAWMALVAALIAVEKTLPWRHTATYGTALVLVALGLLLLAAPEAIPGLTTSDENGSMVLMDKTRP